MLTENKHLIFFITLFFLCPIGLFFSLKRQHVRKFFLTLTIFSTSLYRFLDINFMSMETYRGTVRGYEVSFIDLIVIILFFTVCLDRKLKKKIIIPGFWPNFFYLGCAFASLYYSNESVYGPYGNFAIFQYVRILVLYWTFYHLIESEHEYRLLIKAVLLNVIVCVFFALQQRYLLGYHRVSSALGHSNLLGAYMNMAGLFLFTRRFIHFSYH